MTDPTSGEAKLSFAVKRVYNAPVDAVWASWTDPKRVMEWWGPDGFTSPLCRMDFREGGTTLVSMSAPGFGELYNTWNYTSIVPQRRIEFVMRFSDDQGAAGRSLPPMAAGCPLWTWQEL